MVVSMTIPILDQLSFACKHGFSFESINDRSPVLSGNHVTYSALMVCLLPIIYVAYKNTEGKKKEPENTSHYIPGSFIFAYSRGMALCDWWCCYPVGNGKKFWCRYYWERWLPQSWRYHGWSQMITTWSLRRILIPLNFIQISVSICRQPISWKMFQRWNVFIAGLPV